MTERPDCSLLVREALRRDRNCRGPSRTMRCHETGSNVPMAMWCNYCIMIALTEKAESSAARPSGPDGSQAIGSAIEIVDHGFAAHPVGVKCSICDGIGSASQSLADVRLEMFQREHERVTQLESSLTALRGEVRELTEAASVSLTLILARDEQIAALRGALGQMDEYTQHHSFCALESEYRKADDQCSCGLAELEALASTALAVSRVPQQHQWKTQRAGGHPADADSAERVTFCESCGVEQSDDNRNDSCAVSRVPTTSPPSKGEPAP